MSAWNLKETPVIVHTEHGVMKDTWHRPVRSGPVERWPEDDDRYYDRLTPEPCDVAPDGCRQRDGHMGVCVPTPEQIRGPRGRIEVASSPEAA